MQKWMKIKILKWYIKTGSDRAFSRLPGFTLLAPAPTEEEKGGKVSSVDLHTLLSGQMNPGPHAQTHPCPRRPPAPRAPAILRNPGTQPPLTVAACHWPPGLEGPARAPAHAHQRADKVVATQLLPCLRGGCMGQRQCQGRAQQY